MDDPLGSCTNGFPLTGTLPILAADGGPSAAAVVVCALFVILFSALASMTEAAFLSVSKLEALRLAESPAKLDRLVSRLRLHFAGPLATIVVVNNIANITGSAVTGYLASQYFRAHGWPEQTSAGVFFGVLTLAVILAGEILPKTIGETHHTEVARVMALPVVAAQMVLAPLTWLVGILQKPFLRTHVGHMTSEEEIAHLTALGGEQGAIEEQERDLIHNVFKLNDITAEQIMTPRMELVMLPAAATLDDVEDDLANARRSRIPLYGESRDDIVAVLDRMDALLALAKDRGDIPVTDQSVSFKPFIAPGAMPADELLVALKRRTEPIAVVVGEYGECLGIVTLEDVLEELVGEIRDEEDEFTGNGIQRTSTDEAIALGKAEIRDVNEFFGTQIPNHRTVAGLLLETLERIPHKGERLEIHGLEFTVRDCSERAILKVRIRRLPTPAPAEQAAGEAAAG